MVRRRGDERGLVTLLFTDIVGSSEVATELGDQRWHRLHARHPAVRKALKHLPSQLLLAGVALLPVAHFWLIVLNHHVRPSGVAVPRPSVRHV